MTVVLSEQDKQQIRNEARDRKEFVSSDDFEMSEQELAQQKVRRGSDEQARSDAQVIARTAEICTLGEDGIDGRCPHCFELLEVEGVMTSNEVLNMLCDGGDEPVREFTCGDCGGEWGPLTASALEPAKPGRSTGVAIEKQRETRNGVSRPSAGGKCRAVWDGLDAEGLDTSAKRARELADANGWDRTTTMVQFYKWRKFHGIKGRQKK